MWNKYITIKEAAEFLGVSISTLRNWGKTGKLVAQRHPANNYRLYRFSDLANFAKRTNTKNSRKSKLQLVDE